MSKDEKASTQVAVAAQHDDEMDDWPVENTKLTDCYYEKKDWRLCKAEMERFRQCWKVQGNEKRTDMKDA
ncbi:hypothetical protein V8F20_003948 [Naviculisporaceae sp. PSN 640]